MIKHLRIKARAQRTVRLLINSFFLLFSNKKNIIVTNVSMIVVKDKVKHCNIGDDLNYYIIEELSKKKIFNYCDVIYPNKQNPVYMCIGSIIDWMTTSNSIIGGSGVRDNNNPLPAHPLKVLAVRGPLTRDYLLSNGIECPEVYGDPALLLPHIYPSINIYKRFSMGIILHKNDLNNDIVHKFILEKNQEVTIIDIMHYDNWRDVINHILECKIIISSSLHGLILSDAYDIPNFWIKFSDKTFDGSFKYLDYFASVCRQTKAPIEINNIENLAEILNNPPEFQHIHFNPSPLLSVCPFLSQSKYSNGK